MRIGATITAHLRHFRASEEGTTLTELAVALACFLLILFGMIDFGRLAYHHVTAEKAMHIAARVAAVRPPACAGVPEINARGTTTVSPAPRFGASCSGGTGTCASPDKVTCEGDADNATAAEIWALVSGGLPTGTEISNMQFSYAFDENLGFLGGPYVPMVTVELKDADFRFVSPLGQLVRLGGATPDDSLGADIYLPSFSVSLPGEDLASGENG